MTHQLQGPTLADAKGEKKIRMLKERSALINAQVLQLLDKKMLIWWHILQLRGEALVAWLRGNERCDP